MRGFPKHLATPQDLKNVQDLFPQETMTYLQTLLDGRFVWNTSEVLGTGDNGLSDDTHKIVESEQDGQVVRLQMKLQEDPGAWLFRLGLSVKQAEEIVAGAMDQTTTSVEMVV